MSIGFKGDTKTDKSSDNIGNDPVDDLVNVADDMISEEKSAKKGVKQPFSVKIILLLVVIAIIGIVVIVSLKKNAGESVEVPSGEGQDLLDSVTGTQNNNGIYDEDGNVIAEDAIDPGIVDYYESEAKTAPAEVYKASDFIKDLNGLDVSAVYNVQNRSYVQDYVNYETRRAIIDDGMELYWLEITYNDKKYRIQCPFVYFKDLGEKGICKVEMEVLTLEGGGKIISYMQVIPDSTD